MICDGFLQILGGQNQSRTYYEIYSLDPLEFPSLPVLRKVAIHWFRRGADYGNDYTGW